MLKILLVDDEPLICNSLSDTLSTFPYITVSGIANNSADAWDCLQDTSVDLVFLDIELGDSSGFDLAVRIHAAFPDVLIVFLTGHADFALEGYEYRPFDFLVKPVSLLRLERVLLRAKDVQEKNDALKEPSVRIGLPVDGGMEIIQVDQLLYIEKLGRKVFLVGKNDEKYQSHDTLQKLQGIFEPYGFYRCHQSFMVKISAIRSIYLDDSKNSYNIHLYDTDSVIPLSRNKYSDLKNRLAQNGLKIF